jgi:transcriptional regulator of acetoin/glycerol metabolism
MGMLDLTGIDVPERPELSHLVAHSARAVEDALLLATPHALLLRLNWPGCMLGSDADGLMLLDAEGHIVGCNTAARQLIPQPLHASAQRHCGELLACPWPQLFDAAARKHTAPLDLPLWSGLRLHGMARKAPWPSDKEVFREVTHGFGRADSGATSSSVRQSPGLPAYPTTAPLRAAEAAMIRKAVTDAKGNVAEAARALGISRATVYRKLGAAKRKID